MPPIALEYLDSNKDHSIHSEWKEYYIILEAIRQSGVVNMWGAHPYLASVAHISQKFAQEVLCSWIKNYSELKQLYWPDGKIYLKS